MSPDIFTLSHLMKKEWLVTNVTAVRSADRAEYAILKVILAGPYILLIQAVFVVEESLCGVRRQSRALIVLLRVIY